MIDKNGINNGINTGNYPIVLCPNRVWRTYTGGKLLDIWKGLFNPGDSHLPEEWIASLVSARNPGREHIRDEGMSECETANGKRILLKSLVEAAPELLLGKQHVKRYGADTGVLVKALDSQERLTIQVHPDKATAERIFGSKFGKTEAWYIIGVREINGEAPYVLLGYKPGISRRKWEKLFYSQDIQGLLDSMHKIYVKPGDVFLIEGGTPHAIGPGCFILEIQEPTDYTIRVEQKTPSGLEIPDLLCHQGIGFEKMFECFKYRGYTYEQVTEKWRRKPRISGSNVRTAEKVLISYMDTTCFGMNLINIQSEYTLENKNTFSILVILEGNGELHWDKKKIDVKQGDEIFLPESVKNVICRTKYKGLSIARCLPPKS